ncbi:zinc finger MYM-type protein 4-like [Mugil cephalus]|uniref:zinc finger MYM-type protein 4-like n=1 Tax=Mugil cephalus TaxID=48193 RepID=UPI001FB7AED2|nr:zinc finger MYM-type protein 4-like [Mugil cephalus]
MPVPTCTSHCQGQNCVNTFVARCNAKNQESLRSAFFRKQILNICQILCLADDELDQLAKALGRDIRTESEYYQTPEAAADIAKISMLLTAMESGCLEVFEGKSLEEIEIPDGVEPVVEHETGENSDAGEDIEESETGRSAAKKKSRVSSSRQSWRGRKKTQERENEQTELNNEENNNTNNNTKTEDKSEDGPGKCEEATPEETRSEVNKTSVYFSNDGDANEDFGVDVDTDDEVKNYESDLNLTTRGNDASSNQQLVDGDHEENMEEKESEKEDDADEDDADEAEDDWMDTSDSSSSVNTDKKNNVSSALSRMKEVKIFLPKMDIDKLQTPVHVSQLSSLDIKLPVKDQLISEDDKSDTPPTPPTEPTQPTEEPSCPKSANMTCSHCKKTMMKGHTAYQKKGFPDVFCSKSCLFQMFLHNKPPTRTCHHCLKVISQTLDLIMAAVDSQGTMKDFCSVACLCSFKCPKSVSTQTPRPLCSTCSKSCTTTRELTLNATVRKFCSDVCLEGFCKGNFGVCENCSSTCRREPLTLKLEDATKTVCCEECLDEYKERITTTHQCTMCHVCRPVSDMFYYKTLEGSVRLFCSRHCVSSHKLRPTVTPNIQGNKTTEVTNGASAATEPVSKQKHLGDSYVVCSECGKTVQRGQTLYQTENALQIYCSASCFSQSHPNVRLNTKKCHNCFQVITRPHNIIRAPVDDSGTVKELCSDTCLSSVKARMKVSYPRPHPQVEKICKMCSGSSLCEFKLTLDGVVHGLCSESCVTHYYHKVNNLPLPRCDVCSSLCLDRRLVVKMEDGCKTVCSDRCLVMFKEKVETRQLCLTCQTFHHMSDMVENQNKEGILDFFCSNRCMLVFTAPSFTVSETKSLSSDGMKDKDETESKEVKPLLPKLKCIKEEPVDEFCIQTVSASTVPDDIKHEVNVAKVECTEEEEEEEEVKTGPVFSLTGDSTSTESSTAYTGFPTSCTGCSKDLMDEDTVYQRKDHADIFCSTSCLFKFCQAKLSTCNFCLREIMEPKDALKSAVANEETKKVFCSQPCLSSFNYKEMASTKMPIVLLSSHSRCSMCSRYCISKQEIIQQGAVHKICSDQCFFRFCNLNNLSVCENCHSYCDKSLTVRTEGGHKMVCGAECLTQFKQKIRTPQPCAMCRSSKLMSDMVENKNSEDVVEFFCTSSCATASKVRTASGGPLNCDNCDNMTVPACHLAMTDASIRNFCSLSCAMTFKEKNDKKKDVITASNEASDQTDVHKPAEKLLCALCKSVIRVTPRVIQNQEKTTFVCSLTCCHEYKIVNNITGPCEHCKNERIVRDVKRIDGKDRRFCSEGCKTQYRYELEKTWGGACRPCAYCFCISRIVVTARDEPANKEFCSEVCCTDYKKLVGRETKCDACGLHGDLKKTLSLLGGVKHFCDLKCLLHFCVKKVQVVDEASLSSPPEADDTSGSFPVIVNVVSLAGALAERLKSKKVAAERKKESVADVKTKVVEQKVTKELKNKAVLCAPLVHNKGVSCSDQSLETEKQAVSAEHGDKTSPQVIVLPVPVPVPVFVPVPMNMYSQYTPKPVGLPVPLPVPMFLPEKTNAALDERMNPEGNKREDKHVTEDEEAQESLKNVDRPTTLHLTVGKVHNKNKLNKSEEETSQRSISQNLAPKIPQKLETQCGVDAWRRWIQWRESQTNMGHVSSHAVTFKEDVLSCSTAELSNGLCLFIHEAKLPDGESYSPDGLFHLCLSIQQYLFDNGRFENIFSDLVYSRFTTEFTNILRHLKHPVTASGYIHSRVEEEFLWDCKQLGAYSPIVLLNTLLFFCSKYFGFTTVEQHRQLSFSHLKLCTRTNQNNTNTTFLRFHPPTSLNETDADGVPAKRRKRNEDEDSFLEMMENRQNPLRCPVRLYEFYLSKCPDSVRQRSDVFYLHPDRRCVPSSHLWFSPTPLDASSMEAMIVRILAVRELQKTDEGACVDLHSE